MHSIPQMEKICFFIYLSFSKLKCQIFLHFLINLIHQVKRKCATESKKTSLILV